MGLPLEALHDHLPYRTVETPIRFLVKPFAGQGIHMGQTFKVTVADKKFPLM